jgi:hypothetical protein
MKEGDRSLKVSIIILNWNGGEDILECLKSVKDIDYPDYEIIVVDNGSTDNSVEEIKRTFPDIKLIQNDKNLGFPEGANVGIRAAAGGYIMLLNDDTVVARNILKDLVEAMGSNANIGIAGPMILYHNEPDKIWSAGGRLNFLGYASHIGKGLNKELFNKSYPVDYITGCAVLIKKEVIDKIGLLDPEYFLYFEDADFCLRAKKAGYEYIYVPSPTVWHKATGEWIINPTQAYYYMRNAIVFAKKNLTGLKKFIFIASQFLLMLPYNSLRAIRKGDSRLIKYLLKGLRDGIAYH